MRTFIASFVVLALSQLSLASATDFTIYNQSDSSIQVWVRFGWQQDWPAPTKLGPREKKTYTFQGRGTLDISTAYPFGAGPNEWAQRTVGNVNIETLADYTRERAGLFSIDATAEGRLLEFSNGRWIRRREPLWACPWTFYGQDGKISLVLPQDEFWTGRPPGPFPPDPNPKPDPKPAPEPDPKPDPKPDRELQR